MAILFPVIITTEKALENALSEKYGVIYIDDSLYAQKAQWVQESMNNQGYSLAEMKGLHGVFYIRKSEDISPSVKEIYDPFQIL